MSTERIHRYADADDLAYHVADMLLRDLREVQSRQYLANLCLAGGPVAEDVLAHFGPLVSQYGIDPGRLELWWAVDSFSATTDGTRHVQRALTLLAGQFSVDPARTHPMPTPVGGTDADSAALAYATELGPTRFDVTMLIMGPDGGVAGLTPGSPGLTSNRDAVGVTDDTHTEGARVSLTPRALNRSAEVWIMASGSDCADAARRAVAGDRCVPAGRVRGRSMTRWFLDEAAASHLPYTRCAR